MRTYVRRDGPDAHIRAKAVELRIARRMTIDEIADRLALPRTTIYHWVRDLPIERKPAAAGWSHHAREKAAAANRRKHRLLREAAYDEGVAQFESLATDPTFRDFVCMFLAEGYKRNRNVVSIANSDPAIVRLAAGWLRSLSTRPLFAELQYHVDQDPDDLRSFWAKEIALTDPAVIRLQRKSNSGQLAGRTWRSVHGVLGVGVHDTYLRARLQAWVDCLRRSWT